MGQGRDRGVRKDISTTPWALLGGLDRGEHPGEVGVHPNAQAGSHGQGACHGGSVPLGHLTRGSAVPMVLLVCAAHGTQTTELLPWISAEAPLTAPDPRAGVPSGWVLHTRLVVKPRLSPDLLRAGGSGLAPPQGGLLLWPSSPARWEELFSRMEKGQGVWATQAVTFSCLCSPLKCH